MYNTSHQGKAVGQPELLGQIMQAASCLAGMSQSGIEERK